MEMIMNKIKNTNAPMTAREVLERSTRMNPELGETYGELKKAIIMPLIKATQNNMIMTDLIKDVEKRK